MIVPETGLRFPTFPCFCPSVSIFHEIKRLFVAVLSYEMWKTLPVAGRQSSGRTFQLGFCGQSSGLRHVGVHGDIPIASNSWMVYFMENPKITWMIWGLPRLPQLPAMTSETSMFDGVPSHVWWNWRWVLVSTRNVCQECQEANT